MAFRELCGHVFIFNTCCDEILRVIDSLQLTANYSVATPANWKHGEDVIITAGVKDEDIAAKFPKGHTRIKPYLRTTPQPNI